MGVSTAISKAGNAIFQVVQDGAQNAILLHTKSSVVTDCVAFSMDWFGNVTSVSVFHHCVPTTGYSSHSINNCRVNEQMCCLCGKRHFA